MKLHERRLFLGWLVGWFYYMVLALEVAADTGPIAFPFQAVIGAVFSFVGVGIASLFGLILKIPKIGSNWYRSRIAALSLMIAPTILLFIFFEQLGPLPAYLGQLLVVFGALHLPRPDPGNAQQNAAGQPATRLDSE